MVCLVLVSTFIVKVELRQLNQSHSRELMQSFRGLADGARAVPFARGKRQGRPMRREYDSKRLSPGGPDPKHHSTPPY